MTTPVGSIRSEAFETVLGASPSSVEVAILNQELTGETSLGEVVNRLSSLLGISQQQALGILGVSRSRKSRNPKMSVELLDRTYSALSMFSRVAGILRNEAARSWFATPKEALDGATPLSLLETRVGLAKLQNMLSALEDGAYL